MTINRKSISSSSAGANAYVLDDAHSAFVNFGNLSTSGQLADAIRITAPGANVVNFGRIESSGDGSDGIGVGDADTPVNGVSVKNFGSIVSSGNFVDDGGFGEYPVAIDAFGDNERISNFGSITSISADSAAIGLVGSHGQIRNFGTIDATDVGIVLDSYLGGEHGNLIENYGLIRTHDSENAHGIWIFTEGNEVVNHGTIRAEGTHDFGIALEGSNNHGVNDGLIQATGEQARGVLFFGEGHTFTNAGRIEATGVDSIGFRFAGENELGTDGGIFTNKGIVTAAGLAVFGSDANEHIVNRGTIVGDVDLGAGDDTYLAGSSGHLEGTLTLGDGHDKVTVERHGGNLAIGDFAPVGDSQDVLDVSAFHLHSFADLMSHATQAGADVILTLAGDTHVTLQGMTLGSLNVADFFIG